MSMICRGEMSYEFHQTNSSEGFCSVPTVLITKGTLEGF